MEEENKMYSTMPEKVVKEVVEKRADPLLTHFIEERFD